jgi:hypothetical protein
VAAGFSSMTMRATASTSGPESFISSADAIQALVTAVQYGNKESLRAIFGSDLDQLLTGDEVQDSANFKSFAKAVSEKCTPTEKSANQFTLEIGNDQWPFPIPLVNHSGKWFYDTDAGKEEIINRHIGSDELHAIGVCRAYVTAQRKYSNLKSGGGNNYALKFKSSPWQKDGLYWKTSGNEEESPLTDLVEEAHQEGYGKKAGAPAPHPFHGYLFRILTSQGRAAPGGTMDYLVNGELKRGFALVAYPVRWGHSGIMTFIINQDGKVFQRNLGERTAVAASKMTQYNPTRNWNEVKDAGFVEPKTGG